MTHEFISITARFTRKTLSPITPQKISRELASLTMILEAKDAWDVGVILFDGADILDLAAPIGVLSDIKHKYGPLSGEPAFKIHHLAAESRIYSVGAGKTSIKPDMTFDQALEKLHQFDILVIPGGPPGLVHSMAIGDGPEAYFIKVFAWSDSLNEGRIALSICDGSLFLAAAGALHRLSATSHHTTLDAMKRLDPSIDVVDSTANGRARRYVDGGPNEARMRIVTAGGVTCGLDSSLYVASLKVGDDAAEDWAKMNEYEWNVADEE